MIRLFHHLKHKSHVIFDYNGTILCDTDLCLDTLNLLLKSHNLNSMEEPDYREHFHFPISSFYQKMGFDFEKESFEDISNRYMSHYFNNLDRCRPYEGIRPLLQNLRQHSVKISILTALNHDALHSQLKSFELSGYFDAAFGLPNNFAHSKIQRGRELMEHMGISAAETVIVGDTDHDHEVAKALGTDVILLADGHQSESRLRKTRATVINLDRKPEAL